MSSEQTRLFQPVEVKAIPFCGDRPNLGLGEFVEANGTPFDLINDTYSVTGFTEAITSTKATSIYNMHTYWSKKPHGAIRQYIRHFTNEGDLVLDLFAGSGGTALAALQEGRNAIAIDRSPAAAFIAKNYTTAIDQRKLKRLFAQVSQKVKHEMDWLYGTKCDRCDCSATVNYTVYSSVFPCPRCMTNVAFFDCVEATGSTSTGKAKKISACPICMKNGLAEEIKTSFAKAGCVPVLVNYTCSGACRPARENRIHNDADPKKKKYFLDCDQEKLKEIVAKPIPHWYPKTPMMNVQGDSEPWGVKWRAGTSNFRTVDELFTKRNLWALAAIRSAVEELDDSAEKDTLRFALTAVMLNCSRMYQYRPTLKGGFQKGTYYVPQDSQIINVWRSYSDKIASFQKIDLEIAEGAHGIVSTQSATDLAAIKSSSIDYVFTDPPYADKVQYGELNFVWEAWLGFDTKWHHDEIIVNSFHGKDEEDWADMMRLAMAECFRVLKPGRWLSLCYHDTSEGTWSLIQDIMAEVGFLVDRSESALFIDTGQKSYNQLTADKVNKRDLVINFRKPKPGEAVSSIAITGEEDAKTFNEKVHAIIRSYLESHPGATKDRIYDELVSSMVRSGEMEAHNFEELLRQVAEEISEPRKKNLFDDEDPNLFGDHVVSRWYLKEAELDIADAAESAKEEASAKSIRAFIEKAQENEPSLDGIHYSNLFEHYVYTTHDKPRRALADWLLDYFYKTDSGTYRLPLNDEEERLKTEGRAKGTYRRIKRFIALLQQGVAIPNADRPGNATLAEWILHCKRSGLYEQGKLLYENGGLNVDDLPEEMMVNVEEDYQVCVRMLGRNQK